MTLFLRGLATLVACLLLATAAQAISTSAKQAIVIDEETGTILYEKASSEQMAPSSMTKIMTALIVFDHIEAGRITLDQKFKVSRKAWAKKGSKMFLQEATFVEVDDLLRGLIVQSGNDAAITLAEGIAGSEDAFAELMNRRAAALGMSDSQFKNASGWPDADHYMTARDIATLALYLLRTYPQYYRYFSESEFTYKGIRQRNRNLLLGRPGLGVDGIKTGFTSAGGYGIAVSSVLDGRRVVAVLNGMSSANARAREAERMTDWAQRTFANYTLFETGQVVDFAFVWLGLKKRVPLIVEESIRVTMPRTARENLTARLVYNGPIPAPITAGQRVGDLVLSSPEINEITVPLIAGETVDKLGRIGAVTAGLRHTLFGLDQ